MPALVPFITKSNARELGKLSWKNRKAKPASNPEQSPAIAKADKFLSGQLARVRKQIDMLNDKLEHAESAQDTDRYASAIARLSERERQLANRPLPGSYKPVAQRTKRTYQSAPPADIETRQSVEPTTGGVPPNAS